MDLLGINSAGSGQNEDEDEIAYCNGWKFKGTARRSFSPVKKVDRRY